jgi:hypothetical protein
MRPAVLLLVFAVCTAPPGQAPPAAQAPEVDPLGALEQAAAKQARRGSFAESSRLYRQMAALRPLSPARCRWQIAVVRNTLSAGEKKQMVEEIQRLAALDRTLAAGPVAAASDTQACHRELHDTLADLVFVWGQELTTGCTVSSQYSWPHLETMLHEFLADFPRDERAPEARRALERLYELERRLAGVDRWQSPG